MEIQMTSKTLSYTYNVVLLPKANPKDIIELTTTVTNDAHVAMAWIEQTGQGATLGLEVQYCRNDDDDDSSKKPAILTLCDIGRCLILQLRYVPDKAMIKDLFFRVDRFVGANVEHSVAVLQEEYDVNGVDAFFEDIDVTGGWFDEFTDSASERIVAKLMMDLVMIRKKMPEVEDAVWEKESLDFDLVAYATLESYVYYMIGEGHKYYSVYDDKPEEELKSVFV